MNRQCLVALASMAVSTATVAAGQISTNFAIPRDVVNNGVADMSSTNFRLSSSVGDAVATGPITSVSFKLSNGFRAVVNASPGVLNLLSLVSRKIHGATPFDLTIDKGQPLTGNITVEPRAIGAGHTLVFHFDSPVSSVGAATALDSLMNTAGTATATVLNGDVVATLTNVTDNKRLTLTLNGLNGSATAMASMGFLVGDVNNTRSVNSSDISGVKARSGQSTNTSNFMFDVNASGAINSSDISAVKARSGLVLP